MLLFEPDASDIASAYATSTLAGPSSSPAAAQRPAGSKNIFALWLITKLLSSLVKVSEGDSDSGLLDRLKQVIVEFIRALTLVLVQKNGLPVARCIMDQLLDLYQGQ